MGALILAVMLYPHNADILMPWALQLRANFSPTPNHFLLEDNVSGSQTPLSLPQTLPACKVSAHANETSLQALRVPQLQSSISKLLSLPAPGETSHSSPARNYAWNSICDSKVGLGNNEQAEQKERGALCGRGRCQRYAMLAMATRALGSNPAAGTELCPTGERRAAHSPGRAVYTAHMTARGRLLAAAPAASRISRTGRHCQRLAAIRSCELRGPPAAPRRREGHRAGERGLVLPTSTH